MKKNSFVITLIFGAIYTQVDAATVASQSTTMPQTSASNKGMVCTKPVEIKFPDFSEQCAQLEKMVPGLSLNQDWVSLKQALADRSYTNKDGNLYGKMYSRTLTDDWTLGGYLHQIIQAMPVLRQGALLMQLSNQVTDATSLGDCCSAAQSQQVNKELFAAFKHLTMDQQTVVVNELFGPMPLAKRQALLAEIQKAKSGSQSSSRPNPWAAMYSKHQTTQIPPASQLALEFSALEKSFSFLTTDPKISSQWVAIKTFLLKYAGTTFDQTTNGQELQSILGSLQAIATAYQACSKNNDWNALVILLTPKLL